MATPAPATDPDLAARLNSAFAGGEASFAAQFSSPLMASSWFAVLAHAHASFTSDPDPSRVGVRTTLPGDWRSASETLTLEFASDGTIIGTRDAGVRPIWVLGATELTTATHGTVLSADLPLAARRTWVQRLDRASEVVRKAGILPDDSWDGGLVVEIPADPESFTAITGASSTDTSAVTGCASGTPRIVINPASFSQTSDWLQATLTHEAVHVATQSPCHSGSAWLVEGVAESVSAASDPATAQANAALVRTYLRTNPRPTALPASMATPTDYALAQVAADQVRTKLGVRAIDFITRGIDGTLTEAELAEATNWYLDALPRR